MRFSGAAFIACFASSSLMPNAFAAQSNKISNLRERRTIAIDFVTNNVTEPLGRCQGDCDGDDDCQVGLMCFERPPGGGVAVPGCDGGLEDLTRNDYCIDILTSNNPMVEVNNFTEPLARCQGDCNDDDDCQVGLMCFQRPPGGGVAVPGCNGGLEDLTPSDYCITDPSVSSGASETPSAEPTTSPFPTSDNPKVEVNNFTIPLARCQGDCNNDDDCQVGLMCFQRPPGGGVAVPGCNGGLEDLTPSDYCITDPSVSSAPSATPSGEPTSPSSGPSASPSKVPSVTPSKVPSSVPSASPSKVPSVTPSKVPSSVPSASPSKVPSVTPSNVPSVIPSKVPSVAPTKVPSITPTNVPSVAPTPCVCFLEQEALDLIQELMDRVAILEGPSTSPTFPAPTTFPPPTPPTFPPIGP